MEDSTTWRTTLHYIQRITLFLSCTWFGMIINAFSTKLKKPLTWPRYFYISITTSKHCDRSLHATPIDWPAHHRQQILLSYIANGQMYLTSILQATDGITSLQRVVTQRNHVFNFQSYFTACYPHVMWHATALMGLE